MACAAGPDVSESGLVLALDGANTKSYSQNVFPYPLDGYSWGTSGHQMTVSRDTSTSSPVGNSPLKLITSGTAAYTNTYNSLPFTLSPAAQGQTWTFSFWVKGSSSFSASMLIFESNSSGNYIAYGQPYYSVTTEWTRISGSYTMTQATTAGVQVRIDCYVNGVTLWVDGFQLEKASSASSFNSISNTNGTTWRDLIGNGNTGTLTNGPTYSSANGGSLSFDGTNDFVTTANTTISGSQTFSVWAMVTGGPNAPAGILTQHNYASTANFGINHVGANKLAPSIGYTNGTREYDAKVTNFIITNDVIFNAVLVYNSSENKIYWYINGQLDSSYILSATPKSTNYPICLGRWDGGYGAYYFNGRVYSGNIHNRALTAQEVQQNYNATRGRFGI